MSLKLKYSIALGFILMAGPIYSASNNTAASPEDSLAYVCEACLADIEEGQETAILECTHKCHVDCINKMVKASKENLSYDYMVTVGDITFNAPAPYKIILRCPACNTRLDPRNLYILATKRKQYSESPPATPAHTEQPIVIVATPSVQDLAQQLPNNVPTNNTPQVSIAVNYWPLGIGSLLVGLVAYSMLANKEKNKEISHN
jgi:hypothetical protein